MTKTAHRYTLFEYNSVCIKTETFFITKPRCTIDNEAFCSMKYASCK